VQVLPQAAETKGKLGRGDRPRDVPHAAWRGAKLRADEQESDTRRCRAGRAGKAPRSSFGQGGAQETFRQRIRQLSRRSGGRSISEAIEKLRHYVLGWKAYFGLAQTPSAFLALVKWMRHRLLAIHLKHWKLARRSTGSCWPSG
jgi:hypothetical protein